METARKPVPQREMSLNTRTCDHKLRLITIVVSKVTHYVALQSNPMACWYCFRIVRHSAIATIADGPDHPAHSKSVERGPTRIRLQVLVSSSTTLAGLAIYPGCAVEFNEDMVDRHGRSSRAHAE